jgi:hypothetical protein
MGKFIALPAANETDEEFMTRVRALAEEKIRLNRRPITREFFEAAESLSEVSAHFGGLNRGLSSPSKVKREDSE